MKQTACAIFVRGSAVLLAKRSARKATYAGCWDFIGGHVEPGESCEQALIREAQEEVGLTPLRFAEIGVLRDIQFDARYHLFTVRHWSGGEPSLRGDEHDALGWFTVETACALPQLALDEYRRVLRALDIDRE